MKNPICFRMILRDRQVDVTAEILEFAPELGRAQFSLIIRALDGTLLPWHLEQWELADVAREAGKASRL